jgi:hypothetical protein
VDQNTSQERALQPDILRAWRRRVMAAPALADVLWISKDFLASWAPADLARLPGNCRPDSLKDIYDVATYALMLERARCSTIDEGIEMQQMASFFSSASQRVAVLLHHGLPRVATPVTRVARP